MTAEPQAWVTRVERALRQALARSTPDDEASRRFVEALGYASAGGKRLRALMVYASGGAVGATAERLDAVAAAVEFTHAYSLVHDDLPAMDNDDLRRGQPTVHKAFGEATAILVGDTLNTLAFEVLAADEALDADTRIRLVACLAAAAGARGMVGGQVLDLAAQTGGDTPLTLEALTTLHHRKTGALIQTCFDMAGIAAAASPTEQNALSACGAALGLAYQIQDDVLDVDANTAELGKTAGKDARDGKQTFVSLLGLAAARDRANIAFDRAQDAAQRLRQPAALLDLMDTIRQRRH
ncbi:polyprenyl synthetase family protein [Polycyclovorans algicola]|uniref:polyprenyl synthetase family protein n=1 Tax=Polycyclovorans algicola TaxID=616992 RepID=UPI0004A72ECB|nr:farnesyl diphosphate synthase [Polycyclovorans algicola]